MACFLLALVRVRGVTNPVGGVMQADLRVSVNDVGMKFAKGSGGGVGIC